MHNKPVIDMALTISDLELSEMTAVSIDDKDKAETGMTGPEPVASNAPVRPFAYRDPIGKGSTNGLSHPNRRRSDANTRGE